MGWTVKSSRGAGSGIAKPPGLGGKLVGTLFFGVFFLMGLGFAGALLHEAWQQLATHAWNAVPCKIEESRVEDHGKQEKPYHWAVSYSYSVNGEVRISSQWRRDGKSNFSNYTDAQRLADRYPAGSRATCRVDPADPSQSILEFQFPWIVLFIILPLIFVLIGGVGIYAMWKPDSGAASISGAPVKTLTRSASAAKTGRALSVFFGLFLLIGLGLGLPFFFLPLARMALSRNWQSVPCVIESSRVQTHSGDDSSTFSIDILYRYEIRGETYRSSRYSFMTASSSGYQSKADIVDRYRAGQKAACWVDPADPHDAVLERGFTGDMLFGLIPLGFGAVGFFGILFARSIGRKERAPNLRYASELAAEDVPSFASRGISPADSASPAIQAGPILLKEQAAPLTRLIIAIVIALFWNGIISIFLVQDFKEWAAGNSPWFLTLFMIPFVLVGAGLLVFVVYSFLALFNPRPRSTLDPGRLQIGGTARFEWSVVGACSRIKSLSVTLEATEHATYRRGTTTHTDRSVFHRAVLFETQHPMQIAGGSVDIAIPSPTMHSFKSSNNKIVWVLKIRGDIPRWPDMTGEYEIEVDPIPERNL